MSRSRSSASTVCRLGALALTVLYLCAAPAQAQEDDRREQAKQHFRAGQQAFDAGQYLTAARAFEESYKVLPIPEIAFSMAQAYRLQYFKDKQTQHLDRALEMYQTYVAKKPKGNRLGDSITHIAEIDTILRAERPAGTAPVVTIPEPTTQVMITSLVKGAKGAFQGKTEELPLILDLEPGDYEVEVSADGYVTQKRPFKAVKGRFITVEFTLKARLAQVTVNTDEGAEVAVDGRPQGETPLVRPLRLDAGEHFVAVTRRGHRPWTEQVELSRGQELVLKPKLRTTTQRKVSYAFAGAAGLFAAGTVIAGLAAASSNAHALKISEQFEVGSITQRQFDDYIVFRDERNTRLVIAVSFAVLAGVTLTTGGLLYYLDTPRVRLPPETLDKPVDEQPPSILSVTPTIGPGMAGVAMTGRF